MANSDAPSGCQLARQGNGSPTAAALNLYYVASDATALFIGDPVILSGSADTNGVPAVTRATAGTSARITGFIVGFQPSPNLVANGNTLPATTAGYCLVAEGTGVIYEAQEDSVGGALAATNVGQNINLVAGTGNTIQGSGFELDSSTAGTSATLQMRLLGLAQRPDNEYGANAKWLVRVNLPTEAGISSGVGI